MAASSPYLLFELRNTEDKAIRLRYKDHTFPPIGAIPIQLANFEGPEVDYEVARGLLIQYTIQHIVNLTNRGDTGTSQQYERAVLKAGITVTFHSMKVEWYGNHGATNTVLSCQNWTKIIKALGSRGGIDMIVMNVNVTVNGFEYTVD